MYIYIYIYIYMYMTEWFIVMPRTLKKFYGTEKNIDKGSYLP